MNSTTIVLTSAAGLLIGIISLANSAVGLPNGVIIAQIAGNTITISIPTTAAATGTTTLYFANISQSQLQSSRSSAADQGSAGQILSLANTVANQLSISYWEQGVIVTPTVNLVGASYQFVFRP